MFYVEVRYLYMSCGSAEREEKHSRFDIISITISTQYIIIASCIFPFLTRLAVQTLSTHVW